MASKPTATAANLRHDDVAPPAKNLKFKQFRIPKTAEVVAGHIRKMIIRGELKPGDSLQPEAQLMERFSTSRPTIREAFRILEAEQFITVRRGSRSGAQVHLPTVDSVARYAGFALQAQGTTLADLYSARLCIEPYAAAIVAARSDAGDVAKLRAALAEIDRTLEEGHESEFRRRLVGVHALLVDLAGNNTLSLISATLQGILESHQARFINPPAMAFENRDEELKFRKMGLRSIKRAIDLIEAGDEDGVREHWRRHIENANKVWLSGHAKTTIVDVLD